MPLTIQIADMYLAYYTAIREVPSLTQVRCCTKPTTLSKPMYLANHTFIADVPSIYAGND